MEVGGRLRLRLDRLRDDMLAANSAGADALRRTLHSRLSAIVTALPGNPALTRARSAAEDACLILLTDLAWASDDDVTQARDTALTALEVLDGAVQDAL